MLNEEIEKNIELIKDNFNLLRRGV
jgi:hypothetical protein